MNSQTGRLAMYLVAGASIIVILFGVRGLANIINPILLAIVITITVLPIPSHLTKRGMPGWLALVLTVLLVVIILALVITTVFYSVTKLSTEIGKYAVSGLQNVSNDFFNQQSGVIDQVLDVNPSLDFGPIAQSIAASIINLLVQFGIALLIFFFMISAAISLPSATRLGINPSAPGIGRIAVLTTDVRQYMTILTGINLLVAVGNTILLWILGVDYALLWGLLSWFMGYIPSIGFIIALVPPVLLAYAQYGWQTALIVLIGYILINGGVQNIVQPKIMGDRLRISPVVVFIGLFLWGFLLGGIGAIMAVPLTLLILAIMENFDGTRTIAILFRYTGEAKKEERKAAMEQVKGLWEKTRGTFTLRKTE